MSEEDGNEKYRANVEAIANKLVESTEQELGLKLPKVVATIVEDGAFTFEYVGRDASSEVPDKVLDDMLVWLGMFVAELITPGSE